MAGLMKIDGVVTEGYRVASGLAVNNPFSESSLKLQAPIFKELGLDLEKELPNIYWGTLNLDISNQKFKIVDSDYTFEYVNWTNIVPPETFSFVEVDVLFNQETYKGFIYYPHPETKPSSLLAHNASRLEIITEYIEGLNYGSELSIFVKDQSIEIF